MKIGEICCGFCASLAAGCLLFTGNPGDQYSESLPVRNLLRDWSEDVGYSESHNIQHPALKALVALGPEAIPDLLDAMGSGGGNSGQDSWTKDNAAFVLSQSSAFRGGDRSVPHHAPGSRN